jgi:hypothetical protein
MTRNVLFFIAAFVLFAVAFVLLLVDKEATTKLILELFALAGASFAAGHLP